MASKPPTQAQTIALIADKAGVSKVEVKKILEAMSDVIAAGLKKYKTFTIPPGLGKIKVVHKKATPSRPGINPFTKKPTVFKAKPAHNVVRVHALKHLKDMV